MGKPSVVLVPCENMKVHKRERENLKGRMRKLYYPKTFLTKMTAHNEETSSMLNVQEHVCSIKKYKIAHSSWKSWLEEIHNISSLPTENKYTMAQNHINVQDHL